MFRRPSGTGKLRGQFLQLEAHRSFSFVGGDKVGPNAEQGLATKRALPACVRWQSNLSGERAEDKQLVPCTGDFGDELGGDGAAVNAHALANIVIGGTVLS